MLQGQSRITGKCHKCSDALRESVTSAVTHYGKVSQVQSRVAGKCFKCSHAWQESVTSAVTRGRKVLWLVVTNAVILVLSYVFSKQPILGLTQEWFRELSFSRLE